tara:strand:+ start:14456 stop:14611 length:156 start_codon:yes stop_codon:yes gene_type:complete
MCEKEDCYFISIIDIGEGEKIYIHYRADLSLPPILIQHYNEATKILAEYPK